MKIVELKKKYWNNRYIGKVRINTKYPVGIKRNIALMCGGIRECVKRHFRLWDYLGEIENVKNNNFEYSFYKEDEKIVMYLPQYETDYLQHYIVNYADFIEWNELEALKGVIGYGKDILDIGANIGNHTLYFGRILKAKSVNSFEPMKDFFNILSRNVSLNELDEIVTLHNTALGNVSGKAKVKHFNPAELGSTQIEASEDGDMTLSRLDDFEFNNIDFIKIDVESFEYDLLLGAKATLLKHSPVIFIEIFNDNYSKVNKLLNDYGYFQFEEVSETNYLYKRS